MFFSGRLRITSFSFLHFLIFQLRQFDFLSGLLLKDVLPLVIPVELSVWLNGLAIIKFKEMFIEKLAHHFVVGLFLEF